MNRNLTAVILMILAIGIYFTFTQGMIDGAQAEQAINNQYSVALDHIKELIKVRDDVQVSYRNISSADLERLNKMLPSATNNIHLIVDLNEIATGLHNFELTNVKADVVNTGTQSGGPVVIQGGPGTPNLLASTSLAQVKVTFTAKTTLLQFTGFLTDVQNMLRITDVNHLNIKANDTGIYEFQVELRTYWLKS